MIEKEKMVKQTEYKNKFEAKLSWKRKEALRLSKSIFDFIDEQTDYKLPEHKHLHNYKVEVDDLISDIDDEFHEIINLYYILRRVGFTLGSLFEDSDGEYRTVPIMHIYSRNRVDPVWNWRKSQLVRQLFKKYIFEKKIWENTFPVHMVLTVPHQDGRYEGKQFYGDLVLKKFNWMRKQVWWKKMVDGGEYGLEVKRGKGGKHGMHIHIHSLVLLRKGVSFKAFTKEVKSSWLKITGATQLWVEPLYFFKKDDSGRYITELKPKGNLETKESVDGMYQTDFVETGEFIVSRKKFYIDREIRKVNKDDSLTLQEKSEKIAEMYLSGVMETVKYHFKQDSFFDNNGVYDVFLLNDVLQNTKYKRLFGRYGSMYGQPDLNFNNLKNLMSADTGENETIAVVDEEIGDKDEANAGVVMAKAKRVVTNPFTGEDMPISETKMVLYLAEKRNFNPAHSILPFSEYTDARSFMMELNTSDIKVIAKKLALGKLNELLL